MGVSQPLTAADQSATEPFVASADIRSFVEALDEPAMVLDGSMIALANRAALELLGPAIEGKDIRLAIRNPQALEHILPGVPGEIEVTGIGGFGRPWSLSIRRLDGRLLLLRLIDRSTAIAAERMRVDFVANASHELRTPLSTLLGYAETLSEDAELDPQLCGRFGGVIRTEAKRMLQIIEDLMSLSRIEADRFAAPTDRVSLAEVVDSATENVRRFSGAENCNIQVVLDKDLPGVSGDHAQLTQLLDNLLTNAIRYGGGPDGGMIRVSAVRDNDSVILSVADNGPGIPRDHLPRITERFYRVDPARSRETGGTGLGLAIVKHIVERHKGSLDIRSSPGAGTEVIVRLPAAN